MARAPAARDLPPPLELLCLKALWTLGEGNVNDIRNVTNRIKPLAYTTVMTLLDRLARKGVASRRKVGRAFVYTPRISEESIRKLALQQFVTSYFDGSAEQLIDFLRQAPSANSRADSRETQSRLDSGLDTALL